MSGFGAMLGGFGGATVGASVVQLILDTKRFDAGLVGARARLNTGTVAMQTGVSKFAAFAKAGFAIAAIAAVAFAAKAVKAASDQEEALNKAKVVFGQASAAVEEFAETSAKSFGISKTAALSAAAGFGNMLITAGLAEDAAAAMSVNLVKLAADMASFNNIDPTEALDKLRAGLAGEAEPLRVLGVQLSETRVKAKAYASGIAEVGDELTDAQKVQARYGVILEDTGKQQGDFARTSGSAANQQRILAAQVEDLAAKVGRDLLPVFKLLLEAVTAVVGPISTLIELFRGGADPIKAATAELASFGHTSVEVRKMVDDATKSFTNQTDALRGGRTMGAAMGKALEDLVGKERRAAEEAEGWAKRQQAVIAAMDDTTESTRKASGGMKRLARVAGVEMNEFQDSVRESTNFVRARWEDLAGQSRVTATQIIRQFNRALRDQAAFAANTREFANNVREAFAGRIPLAAQQMIADLGQRKTEGAAIMAGLADANQQQIRRIITQWKAGERGPEQYMGMLDRLLSKVNTLDRKSITIPIEFAFSSTGSLPSGVSGRGISDYLASELIRGQRG